MKTALASKPRGYTSPTPYKPGAKTIAREKTNAQRAILRQEAVADAASRWLAADNDTGVLSATPDRFMVPLSTLKTTVGRKAHLT